ncbi:Uncharacterised protein [Vibrio cholerae]|nr:Uncharacterised protein [Vibrio cholerae]
MRKNAAGQKPVNALWIRFTPTNTVNHRKLGWTNQVRMTESRTMLPANTLTPFSIVMLLTSVVVCSELYA